MATLKKILIIPFFIVTGGVLLAQDSGAKPRLTLIGHATVLLEGTEATFLTDPFFKSRMLWLKRQVPPSLQPDQIPVLDAVLVTHTHPDHFDQEAILALRPHPVVVMPWGRGDSLRKKGLTVVSLRPWETWVCKNTRITAVPARHNAWHNLGYLIEMDGVTLYFTGDTKWFADLKKIGARGVDYMLMPFAGTPVIGNIWTPRDAVRAVQMVNPGTCVPIHTGTFPHWLTGKPTVSPESFAQILDSVAPHPNCLILHPGQTAPMVRSRLLPSFVDQGNVAATP
jgi:L-ascorbate metabolism protein UlaG (beta-lactamase superfamily)